MRDFFSNPNFTRLRQCIRDFLGKAVAALLHGTGNLWSCLNVAGFDRRRRLHFFINIGVGIAIAIPLHFLERTDWGEYMINKAFDFVIVGEAVKAAESMESVQAQKNAGISDEIVFVEIDNETYRKWGRPLITPRDKLASALETVSQGGAKLVVLDILLDYEDCCSRQGDWDLGKLLQDMTEQKAATKVIFPLALNRDRTVRAHLFKDLVDKNPNFYFAVADLGATATDRVVRYWVPYQTSIGNAHDPVLWNISFLAAMLADEKGLELREVEEKIRDRGLYEEHRFTLRNGKEIVLPPIGDEVYLNRIRFFLIPPNTLSRHEGGNLTINGAWRIDEILHGDFRDKIVIIGNSSTDAGDMHPTPAGEMAGMYIIGNAVNTISLGIQPSHPSPGLIVFIEVVLILAAAYLFLYFQSLLAQILISAPLVAGGWIFSYYYFYKTGVFLNFAFAVTAMGLHRVLADMEEIIAKRGKRSAH